MASYLKVVLPKSGILPPYVHGNLGGSGSMLNGPQKTFKLDTWRSLGVIFEPDIPYFLSKQDSTAAICPRCEVW